MSDNINISSKGKRTEGEKSAEQKKRLQEIEARKTSDKAAAASAKTAQEAEAKERERAKREAQKAAEAARVEAEKAAARREAVGKAGGVALSAGGAALGELAKSAKKGQLKFSGKTVFFTVLALVIIALLLFLAWPRLSGYLYPDEAPVVATELDEEETMANTTAEINSVILGEARQKRELVVWEQDVQVESEVSQALANISVFKRSKTFTSFGTGVYTVDMGQIGEDSITVDQDAHTVTMSIPHAKLQYITKDLSKTEFQDTQHNILGFGDVKLTQEQQTLLEQSIEEAMRAELETDACFADADNAALLEVYDVYAPLITKVDNTYTLEVRFAD